MLILKAAMNTEDVNDKRFVWPKTHNPFTIAVKYLGGYSILLILAIIYIHDRLNIQTKLPALIFIDSFMLSLAWASFQQKYGVYKLLGWVIIFAVLVITLEELDLLPLIDLRRLMTELKVH